MNRPTEPDEILAMPDAERDAIAAKVCMGWRKTPKHIPAIDPDDVICWTDDDEHVIHLVGGYQPSQPTEKGKAQCWGLADKFGLVVMFEENKVMYRDRDKCWHQIEGILQTEDECQSTVVTAAILAAQTEQEK